MNTQTHLSWTDVTETPITFSMSDSLLKGNPYPTESVIVIFTKVIHNPYVCFFKRIFRSDFSLGA